MGIMGMFFLTFAGGQNEVPSLAVTLDRTKTIQVEDQEIKIDGTFVTAQDGRKGLAFGGKQNRLIIPAFEAAGDTGTIIFTFMTRPVKPGNISTVSCGRSILALRGIGRQTVAFYQLPNHEILYFAFKNYNEPQSLNSIEPIEFNRWYQAACTWDGTTVRFFLDGVLQGQTPQPYVPEFTKSCRFYFGPYIDNCTNPPSWDEDSCIIRDIKVYKKALSPEKILAAAGIKALDASKQYKPFLAVPQTAAAPAIDGKLDDQAWQYAASMITLIDGQKPDESLSYKDNNPKFCHDGKNLYIGFQAVFPGTYKINGGEPRGADKEADVWGEESFELWFDINDKLYRWGGNVAGGYCECIFPDSSFNGKWQYQVSLSTSIDDSRLWQGEICIPFETIGINSPVGKEIKANFCRTWLGFGRIGLTALTGTENYLEKDLFATLKISGDNCAFQEIKINNPNDGILAQKVQFFSAANTNFDYTVTLLSSIGAAPQQALINKTVTLKSGQAKKTDFNGTIANNCYDRLLFQVRNKDNSALLMQQVVPFKLGDNYLEVIPAFGSAKVFIKPRYKSLSGKTGGNPVMVEIVSPADKIVFSRTVSSDEELALPFARDNQPGIYKAAIYSVINHKKKIFSAKSFVYPGIEPWEKTIPEERVLPPFEPMTVKKHGKSIDIGMWGRVYKYDNSPLPAEIIALRQPVLNAAALYVNGSKVTYPLKITESVPYRVELEGGIKTEGYDLDQKSWMEYDGFLWNSIKLKAKKDISGICLKIAIPEAAAKFLHVTKSGFGAGGRLTEMLDKNFALAFWPFVWIGDYEHGLCWFAESDSAWKPSDAAPIKIVKAGKQTVLTIDFADKLTKGQDIKLEFGLIATPVKPLPKNYPLNMFGDYWAVHLNRKLPRTPVTANALIINAGAGEGFYDLPPDAAAPTPAKTRLLKAIAASNNANCFPYQSAIMIPEEYPAVKANFQEWQIGPANHLSYKYKESDTKSFTWYYLCPSSHAADYYLYRFKELVKDLKLKGIYFDFGTVVACNNHYHGCQGGYTIRSKREFYKRIAGILADANNGEYTIVVHNSESVQIPVFTFATHFLNGEGLRQASSATFHFGKDLLDTYTIVDFASEHSSLPWGVTSSIYVPADPLAPQFGGDKEGGPGPQELYRFRMTKAVMAGSLIHDTIPSQARLHYGWFDKVIRFYQDFGVPQAEFMPYWRNGKYVRLVKGKDIYISFYYRKDKKEILAVISHVAKEHLDQEVVLAFNPAAFGLKKLISATELLSSPDPEYQSLYNEKSDPKLAGSDDIATAELLNLPNRMRNPVELGDFGVEFEGLDNNQIRLKLKHHSVALVKIKAE